MKIKNASGVTSKTPKKRRVKNVDINLRGGMKEEAAWRKVFIEALKEFPVVQHACDAAKISRPSAYRNRERSASFRAQWDNAMRSGIERLEATAFKRASRLDGMTVRTVSKNENGEVVIREVVKEPSATLAIFLLKSHNPEKFRETIKTQVVGKDDGAIKVETTVERLPDQELDRIIAQAAARGALTKDMIELFALEAVEKVKALPEPNGHEQAN